MAGPTLDMSSGPWPPRPPSSSTPRGAAPGRRLPPINDSSRPATATETSRPPTRAAARKYADLHQLEQRLSRATSRAVAENAPKPLQRIAALLLDEEAAAPYGSAASVVEDAVEEARGVASDAEAEIEHEWTVTGWVDSLDVDRMVAEALLEPLGAEIAKSGAAQLAYMRSLAEHGRS